MITQSYIKVGYETSQIMDLGVIFSDPVKMAAVDQFKKRMVAANVLCPFLVIALNLFLYFGLRLKISWCYYIGNFG